MSDLLIFGFGLAVTLVVGSGLATFIVAENRSRRASGSSSPGRHPSGAETTP